MEQNHHRVTENNTLSKNKIAIYWSKIKTKINTVVRIKNQTFAENKGERTTVKIGRTVKALIDHKTVNWSENPAKTSQKMLCKHLKVCGIIAVSTMVIAFVTSLIPGFHDFIKNIIDFIKNIIDNIKSLWDFIIYVFKEYWATLIGYKMLIGFLISAGLFLFGVAKNNSYIMYVSSFSIRSFTTFLLIQAIIESIVQAFIVFEWDFAWMNVLPTPYGYPVAAVVTFSFLYWATFYLTFTCFNRNHKASSEARNKASKEQNLKQGTPE
ncbi:hypothetical protein [Photobacterium leiognathi]|uniref:hypothetical protein n=1 Tax=Photobacterium leiognathi TaxID=553611 RepID=UPI002981E53A|nr:hypothetical protein [Photobacterium leiognathi]